VPASAQAEQIVDHLDDTAHLDGVAGRDGAIMVWASWGDERSAITAKLLEIGPGGDVSRAGTTPYKATLSP
jgi:hypothetical protein